MKKMMRCLVVVFSLISVSSAQWVKTSLDSVDVRALAVSGNKLFAGTESGVYLTTNNATNWIKANAGLPANKTVQSFAFSDINIFAATDTGVYTSTNDGTSWNSASSGLTNLKVSVLAVSGSNLFAGTTGGVFLSLNNGTNWTKTSLDTGYISSLSVCVNNIFAGTNNGVFLSTNSGVNWNHINSYAVSGVYAFPNKTGGTTILAIHHFTDDAASVFRSTNNGNSWVNIFSIGGWIKSIVYIDTILFMSAHGLMLKNIGSNSYSNSEMVFDLLSCSHDYGETWAKVDSGLSGSSIPGITRVNALTVMGNNLFAGRVGPGHNGGVWRRPLSEMISDVKQLSSQLPEKYSLSQNYPNPFNPSTTITYSIPERSTVRLSIFNTLGQKISEMVNETKDAGFYEHNFHASQLSSGIYFYRIEATSVSNSKTFVETKKMILMK